MNYYLYTLVDITETQVRCGNDMIARNQQRNFDTVVQTIGLYGNIYYDHSPKIVSTDLLGKHTDNIWYFEWKMEIEDIFKTDSDPIARLIHIFDYVPIILDLTETASFTQPVFMSGENVVFGFK